MFFKRRRTKNQDRDLLQQMKIEESNRVLLAAATETANAAHDVTNLLKDRLEDSLKKFESTARILNDALIMCDMNGIITVSNPSAERLFGGPLIETSVLKLFERGGEALTGTKELWSVLKDETNWLPVADEPLQGRRADASLFWIEPSLTRLDWSDKTSSMLLLVRDVTHIVLLNETDQRYRSMFETNIDGILIEQNGIIVAANPTIKRLFGHNTKELLTRSVLDLFGEEDHSHVAAHDDATQHFSVRGIHASGCSLNLIFTATRITWDNKAARLITIKDVTDMRRLIEASELSRR